MAASGISVQIKGLDKLRKNFERYPTISEPIYQRAIDASAAVFGKNTLKDDPVPWRTGALTQTFEFRSSRLRAVWRPTRLYAPFVEFGTRFMKARPFMGKIVEKSEREIGRLFESALDKVTQEIARI
jgi:hypothetical protein